MTWKIEWDDRARRELRHLDKQTQANILKYLRERIAAKEGPKRFGKGLSYEKNGLWRYPVGDYRIICRIYEEELSVLVLMVGHHKHVYEL